MFRNKILILEPNLLMPESHDFEFRRKITQTI